MPQLLEHIDAIARRLKRGVLLIRFDEHLKNKEQSDWFSFEYETSEMRKTVIDWLDKKGIAWRDCFGLASTNGFCSYRGQIYVDVPYDDNLPIYKELEAYLENPDGTTRFPEVGFYYCSLEKAMENAEHDEPGFWDRWAEKF